MAKTKTQATQQAIKAVKNASDEIDEILSKHRTDLLAAVATLLLSSWPSKKPNQKQLMTLLNKVSLEEAADDDNDEDDEKSETKGDAELPEDWDDNKVKNLRKAMNRNAKAGGEGYVNIVGNRVKKDTKGCVFDDELHICAPKANKDDFELVVAWLNANPARGGGRKPAAKKPAAKKTGAKKPAKDDDDESEEEKPTKKASGGKKTTKKSDDSDEDEDDKPAKDDDSEEDDDEPPAKSKKTAKKSDDSEDADDDDDEPPAKGKKTAKKSDDSEDADDEDEDDKPAAKSDDDSEDADDEDDAKYIDGYDAEKLEKLRKSIAKAEKGTHINIDSCKVVTNNAANKKKFSFNDAKKIAIPLQKDAGDQKAYEKRVLAMLA